MKKILCVGHSAYDITMLTDHFPVEDIKYRVDEKAECGGGPAANAAYLLKKWGMDETYYMGVVGNDIYGKRIVEEFMENDMKLDYVQAQMECETPVSLIIANKANGSRTLLNYNTKKLALDLERIHFPADVDVILTDAHELQATLKAIEANPNAVTVLDAGRVNGNNLILAKLVDYLVCSKDFAENFTNMKIDIRDQANLEKVFSILEKEFKNTIVITLGQEGSLYKNETVKLVPTIKVIAVDSTGAGDIYHGGFTYAIANGYKLEDAMKIGSAAGALSVMKLGSRYSIPNLKEVLDEYDKIK